MEPLLRELAAAYAQRYDHVTFAFAAVGSAGGIEALRRGGADLALVSRLLQPEEEYDPASGSRTLAYTVIAQDGIAVVVNESNPVRELTRYAVRNLFGGQTLSWDEVGGPVQEVTVVSREDGSGTRAAFEATVMSGQRVTPTAVVMPSSEAVRDYVAAHVWAIGYLSMGCLGPGVAALTVDGVPPDQQSVERGTYGITRPFLLVSLDEPAVDISSFMQWARCPAAQAIVRIRYGGASSASR
jgi:phosphate transport system substrate-binding protein